MFNSISMKVNTLKKNGNFSKNVFIISMLIIPVLHFLVFFVWVNVDMIFSTFRTFEFPEGQVFAGVSNYVEVTSKILHEKETQRVLLNSLLYLPVTCFISLPLSIIFSFFLSKTIPFSKFFRVVYFLPNILPIVVLTMAFSFSFDASWGPVNDILRNVFNMELVPNWFGEYPTNQYMILMYCVWAGLGFNILLLSGAIARIPVELKEYTLLEGATMFQEFRYVTIPLIWSTISTTFLLGCTSVFTVMLQPLLLTPGNSNTRTLALSIYQAVLQNQSLEYYATLGLVCSIIGLPMIILIKKGINSVYDDVDF